MGASKTILIVDDEPDVLKVLQARLKANGYQVLTAGGGQEGLKAAKRDRPDLLILDLMMPDMEGGEVAQRLLEDENTKSIPVIFLTALLTSSEGDPRLQANRRNVIFPKTYDVQALLAKIKELTS
jgi:CheY-like chemotaxis protein